jgi:hypothetical protein
MSANKLKRKPGITIKPAAEPYSATTSTLDPIPAPAPYTLKTKLILRMDKIMSGSFAGLYQLVSIGPDGEEKILTDANTVQYLIVLAHKAIMGAL